MLPLKKGDAVSYVLAEAAGQASAISARLLRFSPRSQQDMEDFFRDTLDLIRTSAANQVYTLVIELLFLVTDLSSKLRPMISYITHTGIPKSEHI